MQNIAPGDEYHSRVEWPYHLDEASASLPASFIPLLICNVPPSSADVELVKEFRAPIIEKISECRRAEDEIWEKIQELQHQLFKARLSRLPFQKQLHACEVIVSPFRRVPDDVIHEIIQHCPIYHNGGHFPSILSQVCRSWRKLVHGTSSLWKETRFFWPGETDPVAMFDHHARLSRSLPLTLLLNERKHDYETPEKGMNSMSFLQHLTSDVAVTRRLEALEIVAPRQYELMQILKDKEFPLLKLCLLLLPAGSTEEEEDLEEDEQDRHVFVTIHEILGNAPRLTQMCFGGEDLSMLPLQQRPHEELGRWSQLTMLNIDVAVCMYLEEWSFLLKLCSNIERVWVPITGTEDEIIFPLPDLANPYVHQHLQDLVIQYKDYDQHILLPFAGFHFPKLDALEIRFSGDDNTFDVRDDLHYSDFIDVFPSLETLILGNSAEVKAEFQGIIPLLQAVPTTKSLFMSFSNDQSVQFLNFLQVPLEGLDRLPLHNLRHLEMSFTPVLGVPWLKDIDDQLTAALSDTYRLRSPTAGPAPLSNTTEATNPIPAVLHKMIVRYNHWGGRGEVPESRMGMALYFYHLGNQIQELEGVDIEVQLSPRGYTQANPLMERFLGSFNYLKS